MCCLAWSSQLQLAPEGPQLEKKSQAQAAVAQWIERWPANHRVPSSIPSWGTCLGCRPGSQYGVQEKQPYVELMFLSLPPSFSLPLEINK